jgi:hypothetical protein
MVNPVSTTLTPSSRNGGVNQLDYAIQSRIYDLNTMLPCEIIATRTNNGVIDGNFYDVQSLFYPRNAKGQPARDQNGVLIPRPIMTNVTSGIMSAGICAIIMPYKIGDKVWVSFCQRDITNSINTKFMPTTPASARALSLCDGVIKCHIDNLPAETYTTNIKFNTDGTLSITTTSGKAVNVISGGDANITSTGNTTITAPTIKLNGDVTISGSTTMENGASITNGLTTDTATIDGKDFATHLHNNIPPQGTYTAPSGGGLVTGTSGIPV